MKPLLILVTFLTFIFLTGCDNSNSPVMPVEKDKSAVTLPGGDGPMLVLQIALEECGESILVDENFNGFTFEQTGDPELPYLVTVYHNWGNRIYKARSFWIERVE